MVSHLGRLEGFYWVAKEGGYAAAARAFPRAITQPAVYQQVRRLEEELGVELLERVAHRRLRLTLAGERLFAFCQPFFAELPELSRSLREDGDRGRLRIEAAGLVIRELLPAWVRRMRRERSDLSIELEEVTAPDFERLRRGEADLLIDYLPEVPADFEEKRVTIAQVFVVVPSDHPLAKTKRFDPGPLVDTPLVSYHPSLRQHAIQLAAVNEHIGPPPQTIAASSVDIILSFVAAGLGYSIIPWLDRRGPRRSGVVALSPKGHARHYPISAVWSQKSPIATTLKSIVARLVGTS